MIDINKMSSHMLIDVDWVNCSAVWLYIVTEVQCVVFVCCFVISRQGHHVVLDLSLRASGAKQKTPRLVTQCHFLSALFSQIIILFWMVLYDCTGTFHVIDSTVLQVLKSIVLYISFYTVVMFTASHKNKELVIDTVAGWSLAAMASCHVTCPHDSLLIMC